MCGCAIFEAVQRGVAPFGERRRDHRRGNDAA